MYIDPKGEKWLSAVKNYPFLAQYSEPLKKMNRKLLGRDQQIRTLLATFERMELSNALLLASPGSGKALDDNTPIPVDDARGYVRIGDIKAGDVTFDEDGIPTRVIGVYPQGHRQAYEVIFEHGERIVCNDEHLWSVCRRSSDGTFGEFETLSLASLMQRGIFDEQGLPCFGVPTSRAIKRSEPVDADLDVSRLVRRGVVFLPVSDEWLMLSVPDKTHVIAKLREETFSSLVTGEGGIVCSEEDVAYSVAALATSNGMRADIEWQDSRILVHCAYVRTPELIVSVRRLADEIPMTCIRVDSPNSLFICGSCHVVTHNTALVQGTMVEDPTRVYLEVNLARMIADLGNVDELGDRLKSLFGEASDFSSRSKNKLVLFMDEFHQIVQLSPAAVEALKPLLADSGTRGVRVIAATTNREFSEFVEGNQPLVERFSQIRLHEPDKETVVSILQDMAERYGVANKIVGNSLYELIYDVTNRHMSSEAQPRKSIMMLDSMVGWHKYAGRKMNKNLLADVMYQQRNINISFSVDASKIRKELDEHVFAQQYATRAVEQRLQLSVAGLNDPTKPQGSFLLCGSTGTGKTELTKQLARILFPEGTNALVRLDMTEFANPDSLERFRLELTSAVSVQPYCIILLDEVEKACAPVTRILLSVLDDGRLTDRHGRSVSFLNAYIVLTTNAGSEVYKTIAQYESSDDGSGEFVARYDKLIRRSLVKTTGGSKFPPELLGRIDTIVPFQPLSEATMRRIVISKLKELRRRLLDSYGVNLSVGRRVVQYLIQDSLTTDSDAGGARAVMSKLESEVTTNVAAFVNKFPEIRDISVDIKGEMASENKLKVASDAYVVVRGVTD